MKKMWSPWRSVYVESLHVSDGKCQFCSINNSKDDDKTFVVYRAKFNFIVMNIYPYNNGHLLIVPYEHVAKLEDIPNETLHESVELIKHSTIVLGKVFKPHGFNAGLNQGEAAGAGIASHIHFHVVPRWNGDTNFMPVLGETKVLSSDLKDGYDKIKKEFKSTLR